MTAIRFTCPTCRTVLSAESGYAAKKIACPRCGQRLMVPMPPELPRHPNAPNKTVLGEIESIDTSMPNQAPIAAKQPVDLQSTPENEDREDRLEIARRSERPRNIFQRYHRWAGTRSIIFQSLLLGWTAFMFLATSGLLFSASAKQPETRREQDAQATALGMLSCCSCGGYFLVAFPLGVAVIATLESRK